MKLAILTLPGYGHVNPSLPIAQELVARGDEVAYFIPERFAEAVERTGSSIHILDDQFDMMGQLADVRPGMSDSTPRDSTNSTPETF